MLNPGSLYLSEAGRKKKQLSWFWETDGEEKYEFQQHFFKKKNKRSVENADIFIYIVEHLWKYGIIDLKLR